MLKSDEGDKKPDINDEEDLNVAGDKISYDIMKAKGLKNVTRPKS